MNGWLIAVLMFLGGALFGAGMQHGKTLCEGTHAVAVQKVEAQAKKKTRAAIARSQATGQQREQSRAAIDSFFAQLATEASHDTPDALGGCVLPDDRLRRWAAANAGRPDPGAAPGEPDSAAADPAATGLGQVGGPGVEPPRGDAPLPPVGEPALQPAAVSGDRR